MEDARPSSIRRRVLSPVMLIRRSPTSKKRQIIAEDAPRHRRTPPPSPTAEELRAGLALVAEHAAGSSSSNQGLYRPITSAELEPPPAPLFAPASHPPPSSMGRRRNYESEIAEKTELKQLARAKGLNSGMPDITLRHALTTDPDFKNVPKTDKVWLYKWIKDTLHKSDWNT